MTIVVDCSVALKWVLMEEGRGAALALIGRPLLAPDFLRVECANVLALHARRGLISKGAAKTSLNEISTMAGLTYRQTSPYIAAAQELALELEQTVYDCLYLAAAVAEDAVLVTADRRFADAVAKHAAYRLRVQMLGA